MLFPKLVRRENCLFPFIIFHFIFSISVIVVLCLVHPPPLALFLLDLPSTMNERTDGRIDGQTDGRTREHRNGVCYWQITFPDRKLNVCPGRSFLFSTIHVSVQVRSPNGTKIFLKELSSLYTWVCVYIYIIYLFHWNEEITTVVLNLFSLRTPNAKREKCFIHSRVYVCIYVVIVLFMSKHVSNISFSTYIL